VPPPEKTFDTGEVMINYVEDPVSGPPLLMLHGLTSWWHSWDGIALNLAPGWHVARCDFRGHGKSGRVAGAYRIPDYARDIAAFLAGHFTEPVILVGHSLGAMTAIAVAAQAPERVRAIVPLDPPLFLRNSPLATVVGAQDWFSWVYETLKSSPTYEGTLARCRAISPQADEATINELADQIHSIAIDTVGITLQDQLLADWDLEDALQKITCPSLLIHGDWDHGAVVRDEDAAYVKAHLRDAVVVKMPTGSHAFPWEQTEAMMPHLLTFLRSV